MNDTTWESSFEGKCDLCGRKCDLKDVLPGVQFGWSVGYVCKQCSNGRIRGILDGVPPFSKPGQLN